MRKAWEPAYEYAPQVKGAAPRPSPYAQPLRAPGARPSSAAIARSNALSHVSSATSLSTVDSMAELLRPPPLSTGNGARVGGGVLALSSISSTATHAASSPDLHLGGAATMGGGVAGAYVTVGKPVMMSALPGQFMGPSQSLPHLGATTPSHLDEGATTVRSAAAVAAIEREVDELRRRDQAQSAEIQRLKGELEASEDYARAEITLQKAASERAMRMQSESSASHATEVGRLSEEWRRRSEAAEGRVRELEARLVGLKGDVEAQMREKEEREKEARVELLYRQTTRRMMNADLANGWQAWHDLWAAKSYALRRLREVANRLHSPALAGAFEDWFEGALAQRQEAELREMSERAAASAGASDALAVELARVRGEYEARLAAAAEEKRVALERQLTELTGSAEEIAALRAEREKEERVELLHRQFSRRMKNRDLAEGWGAWWELWDAKTYSMRRLREVGNRLHKPALWTAFAEWQRVWEAAAQQAELERLERESRSVEAQLRRARFENGQLELQRVAQDEELRALRERLLAYTGEAGGEAGASVLLVPKLQGDVEELKRQTEANREMAETASRLRTEAEEDMSKERLATKRLLERLLSEQKAKHEAEILGIQEQARLLAARKELQEREERVELLRRQMVRRLMNKGLAESWQAWADFWASKTYAMGRLRQVANRLQKPQLVRAFDDWARMCEREAEAREKGRHFAESRRRFATEAERTEALEAELGKAKAELAAMAEERESLLRKLSRAGGAKDEMQAARAEQLAREKEARVELLGRQITRRIKNRSLAHGWTAWVERWEAKAHALGRLREVGNRLRAPAKARAYYHWLGICEATRRALEQQEAMRREVGLANEKERVAQQLSDMRDMYEAKLQVLQVEMALALKHQKVELTGTMEERERLLAERGRSERIELLRKRSVRRLLSQGLAYGFTAWRELWEARAHALGWMRAVGKRLRRPELSEAFDAWVDEWHGVRRRAEWLEGQKRVSGLQHDMGALEAELTRLREKAATADEERRLRLAAERELVALTGTEEEKAAARSEHEREARITLLCDQMSRRIQNHSLARGWSAWAEMWEAKAYAKQRLLEAAQRLKEPDLFSAFASWAALWAARRRQLEMAELERKSKSAEAQLREAHFENGKLEMLRVAHEHELTTVRAKLRRLAEETAEKDLLIGKSTNITRQNEELSAQLERTARELDQTEAARAEAQDDALKQRAANKELLERLLKEQQRGFDEEMADMKKMVADRTREWRDAAERRAVVEREVRELREELVRLQDQLAAAQKAKQKSSPPPKPPPVKAKDEGKKLKKGTSPLGNIDLDEGPDAPPIAEQLASKLRKNAGRVLDLFQHWDDNGDGEITRAEFHKAMPALGLEVPKQAIDDLFSEWDSSGDGSLSFRELKKILAQTLVKSKGGDKAKKAQFDDPPAPEVKKAGNAMKAVARMQLSVPAP